MLREFEYKPEQRVPRPPSHRPPAGPGPAVPLPEGTGASGSIPGGCQPTRGP